VRADAEEPLPDTDFATLVLSLNHGARVNLGDAPDPATGTAVANPILVKQTIDLLAVLQEKTQGNLTSEEERILEQVLYDLRMRYVEVTK
jgi:hypothetical protein